MSRKFKRILMGALTTMILAAVMAVSASAAKVQTTSNVVLRSSTSASSSKLAVVSSSTTRTVQGISKNGKWIKIKYNGKYGYVAASRTRYTSGYLGKFKLTFYGGDTQTASGRTPRLNHTIAVDPRVISLGSRVFIQGYGTYSADDTGGAIKGKIIDIFVISESVANRMGIDYANVIVY